MSGSQVDCFLATKHIKEKAGLVGNEFGADEV